MAITQEIQDCVDYLRKSARPWLPEASYWHYIDQWWLRTPARRASLWRIMEAVGEDSAVTARDLSMMRRRLRDI